MRMTARPRTRGRLEGRYSIELRVAEEARLHPDRVARCDRDHRHPGGDSVPRLCSGAREGPPGELPVEHKTGQPGLANVYAGLRRDLAVPSERPGGRSRSRL